jgi:D-sedoheptulose 7-phosphate isomerase
MMLSERLRCNRARHLPCAGGEGEVSSILNEGLEVIQALLSDSRLLRTVSEISNVIVKAYRQEKKVLLCGNGGSAADAQHIAAELSGKFFFDREPLFAEALHVNPSYLTAVANDYSFEDVFARLVRAQGSAGDVLVALSTSGNSRNVLNAIEEGHRKEMSVVGFTGKTPNNMEGLCDYLVAIPTPVTPRIQECHITLGHAICEMVESALFSTKRAAVFLYRDWLIDGGISDEGYVEEWAQFSAVPEILEAVGLLKNQEYLVVLITNHCCDSNTIISPRLIKSVHRRIMKIMRSRGTKVDGIYPCRDRSLALPRIVTDFRRRGIEIDLNASFMIGDPSCDEAVGRRKGLNTIKIGRETASGEAAQDRLLDAVRRICAKNRAA